MSSSTYSACLTPDLRLRRLVVRSSILFAMLGVVLLWRLPYPSWQLVPAVGGWLCLFHWQLSRMRRGWAHCDVIRVLPGPLFEVQDRSGIWRATTLESGSFVIGRVAWLRLSIDEGDEIAELLLRSSRRCNNWRRLQVIWRHIGAI